jgi:transcription antitermination factor NusA-like protein
VSPPIKDQFLYEPPSWEEVDPRRRNDMKTPICEVCLKSGILCPGCQQKLDKGEVSELDVKIARALHKASLRNKELKDVTFERSILVDGLAILVVEKSDVPVFMGKGGKALKAISDQVKMDIRVLGDLSEPRVVADDLIRPARLLGVNTVYAVDGTNKYKIRVSHEDAQRMPLGLEDLQALIERLTGQQVSVVFE